MRSEPSLLAESSVSPVQGSNVVTARVWPLRDRSGVSVGDTLVEETGRGVRCMVKSEPAEARVGSGDIPDMISIALMADLCTFADTMGFNACVVGTGYGAETEGEYG